MRRSRRRVRHSYPEVRLLTWEVEKPDENGPCEQRSDGERRVAFYRRLGAKRVYNVEHVIQNRPDLPRVPVYVMVAPAADDPRVELEEAGAMDALKRHYGFQTTGEPFIGD